MKSHRQSSLAQHWVHGKLPIVVSYRQYGELTELQENLRVTKITEAKIGVCQVFLTYYGQDTICVSKIF